MQDIGASQEIGARARISRFLEERLARLTEEIEARTSVEIDAAAVTAGIGHIAHGTDIAGSIRYPAYACGVHGLRPTLGRVPAYNASLPERSIGGQIGAVCSVRRFPACRAALILSATFRTIEVLK